MTNPGPWTPTGQPETKKSRTWWIVGGIVLAVLVVFAAYLMGRGWDEATATDGPARAVDPVPASSVPDNVSEAIPKLLSCSREMMCAGLNNARLKEIRSSIAAVQPREASEGLSEAIGDWHRAYSIFETQWCNQQEFAICDDAAADMDDAVSVMRKIVR